MTSTSVSVPQEPPASPRSWLLLIYQLPPKPDYLRVKVRRRLVALGAVALKQAAYVLPATDDCLEDFQWLRREVVDEAGEASICTVSMIEGVEDDDLIQRFRRDRDVEYRAAAKLADKLTKRATRSDLDRLRKRFVEIGTRDFFDAPGREAAERSLDRLRMAIEPSADQAVDPGETLTSPNGAVWVTRRSVFIDRIASAWLIRRFIDSEARFKFVKATGYRAKRGELRFDMFEGEFTHQGDRCTFEILLHRFGLSDPALVWIAEVVHDLDFKDAKYGHEEAQGIGTVILGLCTANAGDEARLAAGASVFDGLYARMREHET